MYLGFHIHLEPAWLHVGIICFFVCLHNGRFREVIIVWNVPVEARPWPCFNASGSKHHLSPEIHVLDAWSRSITITPHLHRLHAIQTDPSRHIIYTAGVNGIVAWNAAVWTPQTVSRLPHISKIVVSAQGDLACFVQEFQNETGMLLLADTTTWKTRPISKLQFPLSNLIWTADGRHILFNLLNGHRIFIVRLAEVTRRRTASLTGSISGVNLPATAILNPISLDSCQIKTEDGDVVHVGGRIHRIALDPHSERLIVLFQQSSDADHGKHRTFNTNTQPLLASFMVHFDDLSNSHSQPFLLGFVS